MTVKELISKLQECDENAVVLVDLANEPEWYPVENIKMLDLVELRFKEDEKPVRYAPIQSWIDATWITKKVKAVYISCD